MFTITYSACQSPLGNQPIQNVLKLNPVAHIFSGDYVYNDGAAYTILNQNLVEVIFWDFVAQPSGAPANAHTAQLAYDRFRLHYGREGLRNYRDFWAAKDAGKLLVYMQADDHDCKHNNFDHTVTQSAITWPNGVHGQIHNITTQAQVLDIWQRGLAGMQTIYGAYADNPPLGPKNGDRPSAMVGTASASDYPVQYFYRDFGPNGELGGSCVRVIFTDSISYKNPMLDADTAAKVFWGATQRQWIIDTAKDAVAKGCGMVIISSTKDLFNLDNNDGPWTYSVDRDALLSAIDTANLPVIWMCGDKHVPHAGLALKANGQPYDCLSVCACPFGQGIGNLTQYKENLWFSDRNDQCVFGSIDVDADASTVTLGIRDAWSLDVLFSAVVPFGSRVPTKITSNVTPRQSPTPSPIRSAPSVTASPYTYQNTTSKTQQVVVNGGTVSQVAVSRDNTTFDDTGQVKGLFLLGPGDWLKVTYSVAPTTFAVYPMP
jgi:hypothetical protein